MNFDNHPNATSVERIMFYVEVDEREKAQALAKLCDFLEDCYAWDVHWNAQEAF